MQILGVAPLNGVVSLMAVSFGSGRPNKGKMAFKEKTIRGKSKKQVVLSMKLKQTFLIKTQQFCNSLNHFYHGYESNFVKPIEHLVLILWGGPEHL